MSMGLFKTCFVEDREIPSSEDSGVEEGAYVGGANPEKSPISI